MLVGAAVVVAGVTGGIGPDGVALDLARTVVRAAADLAAVVAAGAALVALLAPDRVPRADRVLTTVAPLWLGVLLVETFVRGAVVSGRGSPTCAARTCWVSWPVRVPGPASWWRWPRCSR